MKEQALCSSRIPEGSFIATTVRKNLKSNINEMSFAFGFRGNGKTMNIILLRQLYTEAYVYEIFCEVNVDIFVFCGLILHKETK
jgi:hypothetical protein